MNFDDKYRYSQDVERRSFAERSVKNGYHLNGKTFPCKRMPGDRRNEEGTDEFALREALNEVAKECTRSWVHQQRIKILTWWARSENR